MEDTEKNAPGEDVEHDETELTTGMMASDTVGCASPGGTGDAVRPIYFPAGGLFRLTREVRAQL
jgi:hypothetical protein